MVCKSPGVSILIKTAKNQDCEENANTKMAKRRTKKRTHAKPDQDEVDSIPKSMVIRLGATSMGNHSLNQLVKDFRNVMQPHTAIKLRERKSNKLKDFVVMCGPLKVSHLFVFTQSEKTGNVSLKIAKHPNGPTVTYQVLKYSLNKDIKHFLKKPKSLSNEDLMNPPLLVLNGFSTKTITTDADGNKIEQENPQEKVVISMFQNMFPALNPANTRLNSIKRVLMINKDPETNTLELRHYQITVKEVDINKNLKKLYKSSSNLHKNLPNLSNKKDISSLLLDHDVGAFTSESEMDIDEDAIVKIREEKSIRAHKTNGKHKNVKKPEQESQQQVQPEQDVELEQKPIIDEEEKEIQSRKKAIKLTECGPRMTLKLVKIEDGICSGKILHHEFVKKTDSEIRALEKKHAEKQRLKEARKKEQESNIAKKKAVKDAKKERKMERRRLRKEQLEKEGGEAVDEDGNPISKDVVSSSSDEDSSSSDGEHAYSDVPEDLDSDLFSEVEENEE